MSETNVIWSSSHDPDIIVNGITIPPDEIHSEMQYHPADSLENAKYEATRALIIKELLIQRATELGLCKRDDVIDKPDEIIDILLEKEVQVPQADEATLQRYYANNSNKFFTPPLFDVAHILYLAPSDDAKAREVALYQAESDLTKIKKNPDLFEIIARKTSGCSSAKDGGYLGQISKGQTMPDFEAALFQMQAGELSETPVATKVGYHIIKVYKRVEGAQLPFENVADWIRNDLQQKSCDKAIHQYIQILFGKSDIRGFDYTGATTPLVQ